MNTFKKGNRWHPVTCIGVDDCMDMGLIEWTTEGLPDVDRSRLPKNLFVVEVGGCTLSHAALDGLHGGRAEMVETGAQVRGIRNTRAQAAAEWVEPGDV